MNQIVTLENTGTLQLIAQYKLIWYKREAEIFNEKKILQKSVGYITVKSYKIQLFFENGKNIKDYVVLPKSISNVDLYIKENIDMFMVLWMERCKYMKNCVTIIAVGKYNNK